MRPGVVEQIVEVHEVVVASVQSSSEVSFPLGFFLRSFSADSVPKFVGTLHSAFSKVDR